MRHTLTITILTLTVYTYSAEQSPAEKARNDLVIWITHDTPNYIHRSAYEAAIKTFQEYGGNLSAPDSSGVTILEIAKKAQNNNAIMAVKKALRKTNPPLNTAYERLQLFIRLQKDIFFKTFSNPDYYYGCKNAFELAIHDFQKNGGSLVEDEENKDSLYALAHTVGNWSAVFTLTTCLHKEQQAKEAAKRAKAAIKDSSKK